MINELLEEKCLCNDEDRNIGKFSKNSKMMVFERSFLSLSINISTFYSIFFHFD